MQTLFQQELALQVRQNNTDSAVGLQESSTNLTDDGVISGSDFVKNPVHPCQGNLVLGGHSIIGFVVVLQLATLEPNGLKAKISHFVHKKLENNSAMLLLNTHKRANSQCTF